MGNQGANYVCNVGDQLVSCNRTAELRQGLENMCQYQASYASSNNHRWALDDRFSIYRIEDPATGVSTDIFPIEMNEAFVAGSHGACCRRPVTMHWTDTQSYLPISIKLFCNNYLHSDQG